MQKYYRPMSLKNINNNYLQLLCRELKEILLYPVAEFKEFERRFKFKPRFKYGWFHLKLYQMFPDLSQR